MAGANHGKNWIATWIFGIYKCHLVKIPSKYLAVSETETSQMELLEVAFPSIPSRSARAKFIVFLLLLPRSPSDKFNSSPERFIFQKKKSYISKGFFS